MKPYIKCLSYTIELKNCIKTYKTFSIFKINISYCKEVMTESYT